MPVFGSRLVFVHAGFGVGFGLNVPRTDPYDGPGYDVTPDGVHTCDTADTLTACAVHDPAHTSHRFSDTAVIVAPWYVAPNVENCRNAFAYSEPDRKSVV